MVTAMAKRKAAAPADQPAAEQGGTDSVRVSREMKRMVRWICEIEDIPAQALMNWAALDRITERFEKYRGQVEKEEALEAEREARLAELRRQAKKAAQ